MGDLNREKRRLNIAWNSFSDAVQARLMEQVDKGKTGWDTGFPARSIRDALRDDALRMWIKNRDDKAVDIAARAMMLWWRDQETIPGGTK